MHSLDELLHPITPDRFFAEFHGRKPLHIPAGDSVGKRSLLDWAEFSRLLNQSSIWSASSLKLVRDTVAVPPDQYCRIVKTQSGQVLRPDPAKVAVFMATGASVIAGDAQELTPNLSAVTAMLGRAFAAAVGVNLYCSFKGVRAFGAHYDLHDVFALQVEGEKVWRLYENRADAPVDFPADTPDTRRWLEQSRGRLMTEVRMRPGDVLYLPRGWYHDALAQDGASLHVTFSVTPLYGRIIFSLLEHAAMQDPAFRAFMPPADQDGGKALQAHLSDLGQRLARLAALPAFRDEIAMTQERLIARPARFDLPQTTTLTAYRWTGVRGPACAGPAAHAMQWAMSQADFALEDLIAQFDFVAEADIRAAIEQAEKAGALKRF
ncbi:MULTISPECIES: JmjC domain-containing protein [unclassified Brevundimonas]|uniref:JmjC domain-containing protein n=1 Tax=unclassified Brevundimonas TaxID=2622653 RepID=UPI000CFBD441|nr:MULTISPECIES: cupin domain-containing protein [unclassified Brevundimonas]PRA26000.1 cupin [Brevundimonas sp. MYb27]PQZ77446.1 cupin [Brevundimonas sp. MYb31]PRB13179.1 cupin [Brevundimonas sp. MYb52]PRB33805.1 cupin [Brevundimonas sp. MYb46]PRB44550.1 cupin [Brevundimonas sp. MYb33]